MGDQGKDTVQLFVFNLIDVFIKITAPFKPKYPIFIYLSLIVGNFFPTCWIEHLPVDKLHIFPCSADPLHTDYKNLN